MSHGDPLIFTYSSGFGALALQLKQVRENFCSSWSSLDWGKREWPPIGTIGAGGVRGVKVGSSVVSNVCNVLNCSECPAEEESHYCTVKLRTAARAPPTPPIIVSCNCAL